MTYLIAAAGTGGHVFPGLAVGEALVDLGVEQNAITYVGGDRLEATIYPDQGFRFVEVEVAGLKRSFTAQNLKLPLIVRRARDAIVEEIASSSIEVVLGMGGYVTVPVALAARKVGLPLFIAEQNAWAGLANRVAARWARQKFVSFPETKGLEDGDWVGNPVRREFRAFDRAALRSDGLAEFGLSEGVPTLGVFGGSLGSAAINTAVAEMLATWTGPPVQVVHLTGESHVDEMNERTAAGEVSWRRFGFTRRMDLFFAVCDLAIARGGGGLAELTATGTPSILVPGDFGSSGHQGENAAFLESAGAARVVAEQQLGRLAHEVGRLLFDPVEIETMKTATATVAKPDAAMVVARAMMDAVV